MDVVVVVVVVVVVLVPQPSCRQRRHARPEHANLARLVHIEVLQGRDRRICWQRDIGSILISKLMTSPSGECSSSS